MGCSAKVDDTPSCGGALVRPEAPEVPTFARLRPQGRLVPVLVCERCACTYIVSGGVAYEVSLSSGRTMLPVAIHEADITDTERARLRPHRKCTEPCGPDCARRRQMSVCVGEGK